MFFPWHFLAAGTRAGVAFPCALIHQGMRRGDKGLVGSQQPGKTARLPARRLSPAAAASAVVTSVRQEASLTGLSEERGFVCTRLPSASACGGSLDLGPPTLQLPQPLASLAEGWKEQFPRPSLPGSRPGGFAAFTQLP